VKIVPIKLLNHCTECYGYVVDDGEYVHIADFKVLAASAFKMIKRRPKLMVLPLTTPEGAVQHAGLDEVMSVIERIKPERAIINHMANECDYDRIGELTPPFVRPAYDNMVIEF